MSLFERRRRRQCGRGQRGSTTLEVAVVAPGILLFISLVIYAGRVELAGQAVQQAAEEAARTASISRGHDDGAAEDAARQSLASQSLKCTSTAVHVNGSPGTAGQTAQLTATVICNVKLSDLALPGLPGSKQLKEQATSPLDTYTER